MAGGGKPAGSGVSLRFGWTLSVDSFAVPLGVTFAGGRKFMVQKRDGSLSAKIAFGQSIALFNERLEDGDREGNSGGFGFHCDGKIKRLAPLPWKKAQHGARRPKRTSCGKGGAENSTVNVTVVVSHILLFSGGVFQAPDCGITRPVEPGACFYFALTFVICRECSYPDAIRRVNP